ncbi:MAG: hypothetical protein ABIH66_13475, partial [bacterium]
MGYQEDRKWSDRYIPKIRELVAPHLFVESPVDIDRRKASDLIVIQARDKMLACRVRRPGYAEKYPYQFTIRLNRDSGAETEYAKIASGWADWMFYGHAVSDDSTDIVPWYLIDLHNFRRHLIIDVTRNRVRRKEGVSFGVERNIDGTEFMWFDFRYFAP